MLLKKVLRKPLLPILILLSVLIGVVLPAQFDTVIQHGQKELEKLYRNITIECSLLPQTYIGADFSLDARIGSKILAMPEVSDYYCELNCPYYFRDPGPSSGNSQAFGTNNIMNFAQKHGLILSAETMNAEFEVSQDICVVSERLLKATSRHIGDVVTIAGSEKIEQKDENAPDLQLTIVGTYQETENTDIPWNAIVIPSDCFFDSKLISTTEGILKWRMYSAFDFTIDSQYNREFDRIKSELQEIIGDKWMLYSTSRELYRAVQPMENKLDMQEKIFFILDILLTLLPGFFTILFCKKTQDEVLIPRLYGEKRWCIFLKNWFSVMDIIVLGCGIAACFVWSDCNWKQIASIILISGSAAIIIIGRNCTIHLLSLYQSSEE